MILKLAWRSLWRNRRRTVITVCSIGFGLAFAIFFVALGEGMYNQMIEQVVRMQAGHITIEHPEYASAPAVDLYTPQSPELAGTLASWPDIELTKEIILGQGIAKSGAGSVGAALMGVTPSVEARSSPLARNLVSGAYLEDGDDRLVVIGADMAETLNLDLGKKMVLTTNDVDGNLVEELCRVKGIFRTGSQEIDAYFVQAPLDFTRRLFRLPADAATQVGLILRDPDHQGRVMTEVRDSLRNRSLAVRPWQEVMPELSSYIKMDRGSNIIFQGILIFLVLFTIFNTILMSVLERQREFAILLAVGTRPLQLRLQILAESAFLGLLGCSVGLLCGALASWLVNYIGVDLSSFLQEGIQISGFAMSTTLRTRITPQILFTSSAIVFGATLIISLLPMKRAVGVPMADLLR